MNFRIQASGRRRGRERQKKGQGCKAQMRGTILTLCVLVRNQEGQRYHMAKERRTIGRQRMRNLVQGGQKHIEDSGKQASSK